MAQVTVSPSPTESTPTVAPCPAPSDATGPRGASTRAGCSRPRVFPGAGGAEARSRRDGLRLSQGRLRGLFRLPVRPGLPDRHRHRDRLALGPERVALGVFFPTLGGR